MNEINIINDFCPKCSESGKCLIENKEADCPFIKNRAIVEPNEVIIPLNKLKSCLMGVGG